MSKIVDDIFTAKLIAGLGRAAALPKGADIELFGSMTKQSVWFYLLEVTVENQNTINQEVRALRVAAQDCDHDRVAERLSSLSIETETLLKSRCHRRRRIFPKCDDLLEPKRAKSAFALLASLTLMEGAVLRTRNRPNRKLSKSRIDVLFAPPPSRNFDKRSAERAFVRRMRAAWRWSTACNDSAKEEAMPDNKPARSASRTKPGPFVRLIDGALKAIGTAYPAAKYVDVVETINRVHQQDRNAAHCPRVTINP